MPKSGGEGSDKKLGGGGREVWKTSFRNLETFNLHVPEYVFVFGPL